VRETGSEGLHLAGVFAVRRRQRDAARHDHARQSVRPGDRHHHGRQALVAGRDADDADARRERPDQTAQHHRGVVAIRQRVHHAGRALRPPVTWIGHVTGERHAQRAAQLLRRGAHQQADLPVAGVITEGERAAVVLADAALRAEDQDLGPPHRVGLPAHARVQRPAEEIAAGTFQQVGGFERQGTGRAGLGGDDGLEDGEVGFAGTQRVGGQRRRRHLQSL
jgi:hypothetical protein